MYRYMIHFYSSRYTGVKRIMIHDSQDLRIVSALLNSSPRWKMGHTTYMYLSPILFGQIHFSFSNCNLFARGRDIAAAAAVVFRGGVVIMPF